MLGKLKKNFIIVIIFFFIYLMPNQINAVEEDNSDMFLVENTEETVSSVTSEITKETTESTTLMKMNSIIEISKITKKMIIRSSELKVFDSLEDIEMNTFKGNFEEFLDQEVNATLEAVSEDGGIFYQIELENNLYWLEADSISEKKIESIVERESIRTNLIFIDSGYGIFSNPEKTINSVKLLEAKKYIGQKIIATTRYTTSDGESHYNFKIGEKYFWANTKAFEIEKYETVVERNAIKKEVRFIDSSYGIFSNPEKTINAFRLLEGKNYVGQKITVSVEYMTSDSETHYNIKLGDRYYWANTKAFEIEKYETIVRRESIKQKIKFVDSLYGIYSNPEKTLNSVKIFDSNTYKGNTLTVATRYTTSDGETHYNIKLGDRYYWVNTKAFEIEKYETVDKRETIKLELRFIDSLYGIYNNPEKTQSAEKKLDAKNYKGQKIVATTRYTTSDGEKHYNFLLNNQYYWANSKAFEENKLQTIVERKKIDVDVDFSNGNYGIYNNPENTINANQIDKTSNHLKKVVRATAEYITSEGERHYNILLNGKYYWVNSKATSRIHRIVKRESVNLEAKFVSDSDQFYSVPYRTHPNIQILGNTKTYLNTSVKVTTIYTTDDGESHYNFQLNNKYYWMNSKALKISKVIQEAAVPDFIDISNHQSDLSQGFYNGLKDQGINGVVVKVSEATYYLDPFAKRNILRGRAAGQTVSAYHFAQFNNSAEAKKEATFFDKALESSGFSKNNDGYVVLDLEQAATSVSKEQLTGAANEFISEMKRKGYPRVDLYIGDYYLRTKVNAQSLLIKDPWIAAYPSKPLNHVSSVLYSGGMGAWQFTSSYKLNGYAGNLDASIDYSGKYTNQSGGVYYSSKELNMEQRAKGNSNIYSRPYSLANSMVIDNLSNYVNETLHVMAEVRTDKGNYKQISLNGKIIGFVETSMLY